MGIYIVKFYIRVKTEDRRGIDLFLFFVLVCSIRRPKDYFL